MGNILNKIVSNNTLFIGVIVALCLVVVILVLLIVRAVRENKKINIYEEELEDEEIKKVKNVKKEDIIDSPEEEEKVVEKEKEIELEEPIEIEEEITEEEITERYEEEKQKELEEVKEENSNSEIEELLSRMEEDSKMRPEDVVANFEKEQEAQSIISYKELVDAVKNRQEEIYEDELESKPLATVSDCMKKREEMNESIDVEELINTEEEPIELEATKFKKTDFISPVFGRVEETEKIIKNAKKEKKEEPKKENIKKFDVNDYVSSGETIDLSDMYLKDSDFKNKDIDSEVAITALDEIYNHMASDLMKSNEELGETASLEESTKNEEFLQSLKDFRKNL